MVSKRVIPCLDVKDGRVVKGINFINLRDAGDPIAQATLYDEAGADELCFLDISASHEERGILLDIVKKTAEEIFMPLTVGGGINNISDISNLMMAGADKVSINTSAIRNPDLITQGAKKFGSQSIVVAIDAKRYHHNQGWYVTTHGGRQSADLDALTWAKTAQNAGAGEILLTSMDGDGTQKGYDLELTKAISDLVSIPVIASGGVGTLDHLVDGIIKGGASAVLAASIFHFGTYTINEAKCYMQQHNIHVRSSYT